jgi:hypothetical protein
MCIRDGYYIVTVLLVSLFVYYLSACTFMYFLLPLIFTKAIICCPFPCDCYLYAYSYGVRCRLLNLIFVTSKLIQFLFGVCWVGLGGNSRMTLEAAVWASLLKVDLQVVLTTVYAERRWCTKEEYPSILLIIL